MRYYLAGPIDFTKDGGIGWRAQLKELCKGSNEIVFFDPAASFAFNKVTPALAGFVHDINMYALDQADVLVARMMRGDTSVGTPIEIYRAKEHGKKILLLSDMTESVYIRYLSGFSTTVDDINKLYGAILELENKHEC